MKQRSFGLTIASALIFIVGTSNAQLSGDELAKSQQRRLSIPDKTVVLTFDDGNKSDVSFVAPLLKKHGFGATFYVTSGWTNISGRVDWEDVRQLQSDGFEIGNHSISHPNFLTLSEKEIRDQIETFDRQCAENGVRKATTFAYPGGHHDRRTITALASLGYLNARRTVEPEHPYLDEGGHGRFYDPNEDDPFLIPSTLVRGTTTTLKDLKQAVAKAKNGRITVLTFHGVPDVYPHCSTSPKTFRKYVDYLDKEKCNVISMGDLAKYVDFKKRPKDPYEPILSRLGSVPIKLTAERSQTSEQTDSTKPTPLVFRWNLSSTCRAQTQTAYQLLVASSREKIDAGVADMWDTGKVISDHTFDIVYAGKPLQDERRYWWKVKCWSQTSLHYTEQFEPFIMPEIIERMRLPKSSAERINSFTRQELEPRFALKTQACGITLNKPGDRIAKIRPQINQDHGDVRAVLETDRGTVTYEWRRDTNQAILNVAVPANMAARLQIPKLGWQQVTISTGFSNIWETGKLVDRYNGIEQATENDKTVSFLISSGNYQFFVRPETGS